MMATGEGSKKGERKRKERKGKKREQKKRKENGGKTQKNISILRKGVKILSFDAFRLFFYVKSF